MAEVFSGYAGPGAAAAGANETFTSYVGPAIGVGGTLGTGQLGSGTLGSRGQNAQKADSGLSSLVVSATGSGAILGGVQKTDSGTVTATVTPTGAGGLVLTGSGTVTAALTPTGTGSVTTINPINIVLPAVIGTPQVLNALTVDPGQWSPGATGYTYMWERADNNAGLNTVPTGQTGPTYLVTNADAGKYLRVTVGGLPGTVTATSPWVGPVGVFAGGVRRGAYDARIAWSNVVLGVFQLDRSVLNGGDQLAASAWAETFGGTYDRMGANGTVIDEITITRGRSDDLSQMQAGTAELTVIDYNGILNPKNATSPLYGQTLPQRPCRITMVYNGVTYPLYYGFIRTLDYDPGIRIGQARIELQDLFGWLATGGDGGGGPVIGHTTGIRTDQAIQLVLDSVGWTDTSMTLLAPGDDIAYFEGDGSQSALSLIADLVEASGGLFYIDAAGRAVYENRSTKWLRSSYASLSDEMQVVFPGVNIDAVVNRWVATRQYETVPGDPTTFTGGTPQVAVDGPSAASYGPRSGSIDSKYWPSDDFALAQAQWRLYRTKDAVGTIWGLDIDNRDAAQMAMIAGAELQQIVSISESRTNTSGQYFIEQIQHTISRQDQSHRCHLVLSEKDTTAKPFIIGTDTLGPFLPHQPHPAIWL